MLGVRFIQQIKHGGTLGELEGTKTQQMEYYVDAQQARSWTLHVRWGMLGLVRACCVRSFSKRPVMILTLREPRLAIMKHAWSAGEVTWCVGGLLPLLVAASLRVLNARWYYHGGDQIWSKAKLFLCGNQLLRHGMELGIKLSWDLLTGASFLGGGKCCGSKRTIILRNKIWFSEKPTYSLKYRPARLQISKNI